MIITVISSKGAMNFKMATEHLGYDISNYTEWKPHAEIIRQNKIPVKNIFRMKISNNKIILLKFCKSLQYYLIIYIFVQFHREKYSPHFLLRPQL